MKLIPAEETSRRARTAIAYDGREHGEIQPQTGITSSTFNRIVAKTNPRAAGLDELHAIADACGVPRRFMEEGFAALDDAEAMFRRLDAAEAKAASTEQALAETQKRLDALEQSVKRLASGGQR